MIETEGRIVLFIKHWFLFEFIDSAGMLVRCFLPSKVCPSTSTGPARIPACEVACGIEYGLDLQSLLGQQSIQMRDTQLALRKAGLWTREDYERDPQRAAAILRQRFPSIEVCHIVAAAARSQEAYNE